MRVIFLIFTIFYSSVLYAQNTLKVKQYTTAEGLSQNSINDILEDQAGYIWLASQDGLNRFNGKYFTHFRHNKSDSFSISDNFITRLILDDSGRIWMCTRNFINVYNTKTGRFHKLKIMNENSLSFQIIKSGAYFYLQLTIGTVIEIFRINQSEKFTDAYIDIEKIGQRVNKVNPKKTFSIIPISQDSLWFLSEDLSFLYPSYTDANWDYYFSQDNQTTGLLQWNDTATLVSDLNNIISINPTNKHITVLQSNKGTYDFIPYADDSIWIATNTGLYASSFSNFNVQPIDFEGYNLKNVIFHSLFKDSFGQYWFGTANHGVFVYHAQNQQFQYLSVDAIDHPFVRDVLNEKGNFWMATDLGLFVRYKTGIINKYFQGKKLTGIYLQDQTIYTGTNDGMIYLINHNNLTIDSIYLGKSAEITDFISYNNKIYITSYIGLFQWNPELKSIQQISVEFENFTSYFFTGYVDRNNQLWLGHSDGCSQLANGIWKHYRYADDTNKSPNFNFVSDFAEDQNGGLWMATYGGGLSKLNTDNTFNHFSRENGLINDVVYSMVADQLGQFWLTTNAGITRFDPISLKAVNFDLNTGLKNYNFGISNMVFTSQNTILLGTSDGVVQFDPLNLKPFSIPPRMYWSEIMVNFEAEELYNTPLILNSNRDILSVRFDGLKFDLINDVHYSYKLETESVWIPLPDQLDRIIYNSIPFGNHQLMVRASSKGGHFEDNILTLDVKVLPPMWQRWYFILLASLMLLLLIAVITFYFSRVRIKKKLAELEMKEKVREERERISRDLHDSVGTHFAYIISKLDYLNLTWGQEILADKKDYLSKLTEFSRNGMRMLRETIWVLEQEEVDATGFKRKIEDHLTQCLSHHSIEHHFHFASLFPKINSRTAHHVFRIVQEAISNSIRHANPTTINVDLTFDSSTTVQLSIEDNGTGFDVAASQVANGENYGIKNMMTRASEISALLTIHSDDLGTRLTIISKK